GRAADGAGRSRRSAEVRRRASGPRRERRPAPDSSGRLDDSRRAKVRRAQRLFRSSPGAPVFEVRAELRAPLQGRRREEHRGHERRRAHAHAPEGAGSAAAPDRRARAMIERRLIMNTLDKRTEKMGTRAAIAPAVDIYENKDEVLIFADLPGVTKENVAIRFEKSELTLEGKVNEQLDYRRTFVVPNGIDAEKIAASLTNG